VPAATRGASVTGVKCAFVEDLDVASVKGCAELRVDALNAGLD
jgi:hypothetical protein